MSKCCKSDNYALHLFSRIIAGIYWSNAMSSIKNWFGSFSFILLNNIDHFFQNFRSTPSMRMQTLLPYCSNSPTFSSRACFPVVTWFCNKVICDFKTSISLSFKFLQNFILQIKNRITFKWIKSFSSFFLSGSSLVYFLGGMLRSIMEIWYI